METSTSPASLIDTDYRSTCSLLDTTDGFTQAPPHYRDHTHPPDDLYYAIINNTGHYQWDTSDNYHHGNTINNNRHGDYRDNHSGDIHEAVWIGKDKGLYKSMADIKYKGICSPTTVSNMTVDQLNDTGGHVGLLDRVVQRLATGQAGMTTCWCNFIFGT